MYKHVHSCYMHSCDMRFGATLMCGTILVHVTLVVLFVFIKANGEELTLETRVDLNINLENINTVR